MVSRDEEITKGPKAHYTTDPRIQIHPTTPPSHYASIGSLLTWAFVRKPIICTSCYICIYVTSHYELVILQSFSGQIDVPQEILHGLRNLYHLVSEYNLSVRATYSIITDSDIM